MSVKRMRIMNDSKTFPEKTVPEVDRPASKSLRDSVFIMYRRFEMVRRW